MDKETLSNYGWIVICVLVLAVMLSLASPFGTFVSDAVKSTTIGLFDTNQNALGAVGIVIGDQSFCDHKNTTTIPAGTATEEHPAYDAYTTCADCGKTIGEILYKYTDFSITKDNRGMIGYTGAEKENLIIPATFKGTDGIWYKVVSIADGNAASETFYNCDNLTSIIIPDSVTSIGRGAFVNCDGLTSIIIGENVRNIGKYAFNYCRSLTSITIPDGITNIGESTFAGCSRLMNITIPSSITSIEKFAFSWCRNLTSVTFDGTIEQWNNITKGDSWNQSTGNYTIHCTDGDIEKS